MRTTAGAVWESDGARGIGRALQEKRWASRKGRYDVRTYALSAGAEAQLAAVMIGQQKTRQRMVGAEQLPQSGVINAETGRSAVVVLLATRFGMALPGVVRLCGCCVPGRVSERGLLREEQQTYETQLEQPA